MRRIVLSGFTLIEMSIVIVIIGLLAASILVGRDLIHAAEIRAQITQIEQFNQAAGAFRNKYVCLPGDCKDAVELGLGTAGGAGDNGDGNGKIESLDFQFARRYIGGGEAANFWYHLSKAGMIPGDFPDAGDPTSFLFMMIPGYHTPEIVLRSDRTYTLSTGDSRTLGKKGGVLIVPAGQLSPTNSAWANFTTLFNAPNKMAWFFTSTAFVGTSDSVVGLWYPADLYAIDAKIDDGLPRGGNMRVIGKTMLDWNSAGALTPPTCYTLPLNENSQYNFSVTTSGANDDNATCAVFILTSF